MAPLRHTRGNARQKLAAWLRQGISPRRLAFTLSLGFVIGCIPLIGLPTALCAMVAVAFRLNLPAIQAANYAAMPFQVALIFPFIRLGEKLTPMFAHPPLSMAMLLHSPLQIASHVSVKMLSQLGVLASQALLGWLLLAVPVVLVLTAALSRLLLRIPALAGADPCVLNPEP